jgi:hypothetical protein
MAGNFRGNNIGKNFVPCLVDAVVACCGGEGRAIMRRDGDGGRSARGLTGEFVHLRGVDTRLHLKRISVEGNAQIYNIYISIRSMLSWCCVLYVLMMF